MDVDIACALLSQFSVLVFYLFIHFLCFKMTARTREEGALHNRQICPQARRAAKLSVLSPQITLMWNNSAFCLWCFSSSCLPLLPPYHLCYPELTSQLYRFFFHKSIKFHVIFLFRCGVFCGCTLTQLSCLIVFFLSLQPRSLLDPKVLGLQTGG